MIGQDTRELYRSKGEASVPPLLRIVVAVTHHRILGELLTPYIADYSKSPIIEMVEVATSLNVSQVEGVTDGLREVVVSLSRLSEQSIVRSFARSETPVSFFRKVSEKTLNEQVLPYVWKVVRQSLPLIERLQIPLFVKDAQYQTVNLSERVDLAPVFRCRPRFFFTLTDKGDLLYSLKVSDGLDDVKLFKSAVRVLSPSPAVLLVDKTLYSFADVDANKFLPFASKERVVVSQSVVDGYMRKFVAGCISRWRVSAYGFEVVKRQFPLRAELRTERTVVGFGFHLVFIYGDDECQMGDGASPVSVTQEEGHYVFLRTVRRWDEERAVRELLTQELGLKEYMDMLVVDGDSKMTIEELVRWASVNKPQLDERGIAVSVSDHKTGYYIGRPAFTVNMSTGIDWFDLEMIVSLGEWRIPFSQFYSCLVARKKEYVLPDGSVFVLPDEWFERWVPLSPFVSQSSNGNLRIRQEAASLLPEELRTQVGEDDLTDISVSGISRLGALNATLRPYQEYAVCWMIALARHGRGGILADDMGLGKTIMAAALLSHHYAMKHEGGMPSPSLVIVPSSLVFNWKAELARFTPHLRVSVYSGGHYASGGTLFGSFVGCHVVLVTYGLLRNHKDEFAHQSFEYVIQDESHLVKNPTSKTYAALAGLKAAHRINLSGTPIENSLSDLWAQMNLVNPGMLGSYSFFSSLYVNPVENRGDGLMLDRLRSVIRPYVLRRTKESVLSELPELTVQTISCDMTEEQRSLYERERSAARNGLLAVDGDETGSSTSAQRQATRRFSVFQALMRLRLIANHPRLFDKEYEGASGKMDTAMNYVRNIVAAGHKMLVFSSFVRDLEMFASAMREEGIGFEMLTGSTLNREEVVASFMRRKDAKVFLISLKAGGVGLNLTCADYVLILNPWWNPAAESQAISRAHRQGQRNKVTVYRFISSGTIEEKIDQLQEKKRQLAGGVVESDVNVMPSDEEIWEILNS